MDTHRPLSARRRSGGFTLIELMVVMAIIATLAGLGMVGIPALLRSSEQTAAKDRLTSIYKLLGAYQITHKRWPGSERAGALFPLTVWDGGTLDKTGKDAKVFFDPSLGGEPFADLSNINEEGINWTGPSFERGRRYSASMRNANDHIIVCNKVMAVQDEDDLDFLPHAGKGIVYLTAGGQADFMSADQFTDEIPVVGPNSNIKSLQRMVEYDDQGSADQ